MADTRITDLTAITGANTAAGDVFVVVDVSDSTMAASGTDKKITKTELLTVFEAAGTTATHIADTTDAHAASAVTFTATGTIAATNVQTAVAEVATDAASALSTHEADTSSVHGIADTSILLTTTSTSVLTNKTLDSFTNTIEADGLHVQVRNSSGSTIAKGVPVYVSGYNVGQDLPEVSPADASSSATMPCIGITEAEITNNATGAVDVSGRLTGVDTSAFAVGDELYVSETTGALTTTRPTAPAITQQVATVLRSNASLGVIDISVKAPLVAASDTVSGAVELATDAEALTGTDTARALTPANAAATYVKLEQAVNAQTGTTYTLVAADKGKLVTLSNASAITLTLPQDSDATIAVGSYVDLYQLGAGQVTVAAGTGATLRTSGLTAKARAQYSRLGVQKVSADTWSLFGDLAAS